MGLGHSHGHGHDHTDKVDDALRDSAAGIRAVKISLVVLGITAVAQLVVVALSGSVALFADTVHNFSDALTAVPLWIAFAVSRRSATRRYTYGFGRVEDLAGLFVVAVIAISALVAAVAAVRRLIDPVPLSHLSWVAVAGVVGFIGNEVVAVYRIRVGRRIGSAALRADGLHARTDGLTSLAVVAGAAGTALGYPAADPIVGLLIAGAIGVVLVIAARAVFGLARTGSSYSHGSGDFAIAFSTAAGLRTRSNDTTPQPRTVLSGDGVSPLFQAALEATEEAVYNSLLKATTVTSRAGTADAIPIDKVIEILKRYRALP